MLILPAPGQTSCPKLKPYNLATCEKTLNKNCLNVLTARGATTALQQTVSPHPIRVRYDFIQAASNTYHCSADQVSICPFQEFSSVFHRAPWCEQTIARAMSAKKEGEDAAYEIRRHSPFAFWQRSLSCLKRDFGLARPPVEEKTGVNQRALISTVSRRHNNLYRVRP